MLMCKQNAPVLFATTPIPSNAGTIAEPVPEASAMDQCPFVRGHGLVMEPHSVLDHGHVVQACGNDLVVLQLFADRQAVRKVVKGPWLLVLELIGGADVAQHRGDVRPVACGLFRFQALHVRPHGPGKVALLLVDHGHVVRCAADPGGVTELVIDQEAFPVAIQCSVRIAPQLPTGALHVAGLHHVSWLFGDVGLGEERIGQVNALSGWLNR
jgi:hypothetical protein